MSKLLRNLVILTDEGDILFSHHFNPLWQFGPDSLLIQDFATSLFLLAHQQHYSQSVLSFEDESIGFLHQGSLFYCLVTESYVNEEYLHVLLQKIAILFQNRYGLLIAQFNGSSTFFQGFIDYLYQKQVLPIQRIANRSRYLISKYKAQMKSQQTFQTQHFK